jgi:hypothetical protein
MNDGAGGSPPRSKAGAERASEQSVTDKKLFKPVRVGSPLVVGVVNTPKVPESEPARDVAPPRPPSRGLPRSALASVAVSIVALTTTIIVVALPGKSDGRGNSGTWGPHPAPIGTPEAQPVKDEPKKPEAALGPAVKDPPGVEPTPEPEAPRVADATPVAGVSPDEKVAQTFVLGPVIPERTIVGPSVRATERHHESSYEPVWPLVCSDAGVPDTVLALQELERGVRDLGSSGASKGANEGVELDGGRVGELASRVDELESRRQREKTRIEEALGSRTLGPERQVFSLVELNQLVLIVARTRSFDLELKRLAREEREGEPITRGGFVVTRRGAGEILDPDLRLSWLELAKAIDETVKNMRASDCFEQQQFGEALRQIEEATLRTWVSEFISLFRTSGLRAAEIAELKKAEPKKAPAE